MRRFFILLTLVAGLLPSASAARFTSRLDAVAAELEARLSAGPTGKLRKALEAGVAILVGPDDPSLLTDAAALKTVASGAARLYPDPGDPLETLLAAALDGLVADTRDERDRFDFEVGSQTKAKLKAAGEAALAAVDKALAQAGEAGRKLTSRAGKLVKALSVMKAIRKRLAPGGGPPDCDQFSFTVDGVVVTPHDGGGEIGKDAEGNFRYVDFIAWTQDSTAFGPARYAHFLSLRFDGQSFHGIGTYAVTHDGPVVAKYFMRTAEHVATEGTVEVTSWDPTVRRAEGKFSFRELDGSGNPVLTVTDGTFLVCNASEFVL